MVGSLPGVITGGRALDDTVNGLSKMLQAYPAPIVVWLNEFFGESEKDGKDIEQSISGAVISFLAKRHLESSDTGRARLLDNGALFDEVWPTLPTETKRLFLSKPPEATNQKKP